MEDPSVGLAEEMGKVDRVGAWDRGDFDNVVAGGGQVSALIRDIKPVKEIIEEMVS